MSASAPASASASAPKLTAAEKIAKRKELEALLAEGVSQSTMEKSLERNLEAVHLEVVASGKVKIPINQTYKLQDAAAAHIAATNATATSPIATNMNRLCQSKRRGRVGLA